MQKLSIRILMMRWISFFNDLKIPALTLIQNFIKTPFTLLQNLCLFALTLLQIFYIFALTLIQ